MLRVLLVVAVGLVLAGCTETAEPVRVESSTNPQVPIGLLLEHDGCKVYRFVDAGRYRYLSKCENVTNSSVSSQYTESCGKSCSRVVSDETSTSYPEGKSNDYVNP